MPSSFSFTLPIRLAPKRPTSPDQQNLTRQQTLFTPAESYKLPPGLMYPITCPVATGLPQIDRPCRYPFATPTTQSLVHPPGGLGARPRKRRPRQRNRRQQNPAPDFE
ncbi:hypothetical protein MCOR25_002252 [Pyricularia grisea]|nr:hypothetical protein MCOR25_002252 [Pyricularia grisea]